MQITVTRSPANRQGPDIVDELLTDRRVAIARGRREVDYNSTGRTNESCQCPQHDYIATGTLTGVTEAAERWRGIVRYWSLTLTVDDTGERFTADTRLSIEREARK
jgi:hypothetical protein